MVKIKTIKKMTLPELIKWGSENDITNKTFINASDDEVTFLENGWIETSDTIYPRSTFEVEIEKEIDENTKVPTLIELFVSDYGQIIHTYYRTSIKEAIGDVEDDAKALSKAFYILNDDYTMTLLWKGGGMVE